MSRLFVLLQYLLPHHLLSRVTGKLANSQALSNLLIKPFIKRYGVDLSESRVKDINEFTNFNEFFTRDLEPGARPIATDPDSLISPADGVISQLGDIDNNLILQAKNHQFSLESLLAGDFENASRFYRGKFITVYLSPKDYHRVHMPLKGRLVSTTYIPGRLFSVNQTTTEYVPGLFARNERLVCQFDTAVGQMAVILVGAMIVAGIETVWSGQIAPDSGRHIQKTECRDTITLDKGDELGRFKLGSTVILLLPEDTVTFAAELTAGSGIRMGAALGQLN